MAFEAVTSALKRALSGNKDALGPVSGRAADDPNWLTSTGEEGTYGDIYWPQTNNFYFKKGEWYLKPREDLFPKSEYMSSEGGYKGWNPEALESAVEKALQGETPAVQQAIRKQGEAARSKSALREGKPLASFYPDKLDLGPDDPVKDPPSYFDDPKNLKGLIPELLPEGVDPHRSLTQRALDVGLGIINPQRFGQQASTAISPNVIPTGWDDFYTDPTPKTLTGKALNKWLGEGGILQASTHGDEFRGITGEDARQGTLEALNPLRWASNIPGIDALRDQIGGWGVQKLIQSSPQAAALAAAAALGYGGARGLQAWGEKGAGEARVSEPLMDYPTNIHPPIQRGGYAGSTPTTYRAPISRIAPGLVEDIGWRSPASSLISMTDLGVGGDETSTTVDVMPMISGEQLLQDRGITPTMPDFFVEKAPDDLMIEDLMYNPPFVAAKELIPDITPEVFDDFVTSTILGIDTPQVEQPDVGWQPPMESQVKQALTDYAYGEDVGELQAIAELTEVDPTIAERYTTPGSQDLIDITSQVESFANIPSVQPGAEKPWTPQAPVVPDISEILKAYVPPAEAQTPAVDDFSSMFPAPAVQAPYVEQFEPVTFMGDRDWTPSIDARTLGGPDVGDIDIPPPPPEVEDFSAIQEANRQRMEREAEQERADNERLEEQRKEQRKEAARQKERDKKAAAKQEAADKRAADRAAAKSARISAARQRDIAKAAKASRAAEAAREAATKKRAQEQRDKLDSASKKALQDHMAWMATQTERLAKEEKKRAKRYAGGTGGALMWT